MLQVLRRFSRLNSLNNRENVYSVQYLFRGFGVRFYTNNNSASKTSQQPDPLRLTRQLQARIKATGPITVSDYMREVLTNPIAGYYMHNDVFGEKGDFITSPEISQLFGEMLAIWFLTEWKKIGSPKPLQFVEFGPGRGTLAQDILRVFAKFGLGALDGVSLHLIEVSPHLCDMQAKCLGVADSNVDQSKPHHRCGFTSDGVPVFWYARVEDVPREFSCFLAHEFFDALPIHKLRKTDAGWREILVDMDAEDDVKFRYVMSRSATPASCAYVTAEESRAELEVSVQGSLIVRHLAERIEEDGGFALVADYGHDGSGTDTFRAFRHHRLHDPLVAPGSADLTADVDFSALRAAAIAGGGTITFGPTTQRRFLRQMGIDVRLQRLLAACPEELKEGLRTGHRMMTDTDKMGERFKFFAIFPQVLDEHLRRFPVSGFAEEEEVTNVVRERTVKWSGNGQSSDRMI